MMVAQNMLHSTREIKSFLFKQNKSMYLAAVDVNKCLKQIDLCNSLQTYAQYSELPFCHPMEGKRDEGEINPE